MLNRFQPDYFFPYNICLTSADKQLRLIHNATGEHRGLALVPGSNSP